MATATTLYEIAISNPAIVGYANYVPRINEFLKSEVKRYLQEGFALAMELDVDFVYVPDSFIVNYVTYQIAVIRIGNSVFFTIDDSAYLDHQACYQYICQLLAS